MRDVVVDVADEAQGDVIILRIDPARARQAAAQHRQRLRDLGRNLDAGEKTRHGLQSRTYERDARTRAISSSTFGRIRFDDHIDAGCIGMKAVALVERVVGRHAVEEERIKDDLMSRGKRGEDRVEGSGISRAHVRRRPHAAQ